MGDFFSALRISIAFGLDAGYLCMLNFSFSLLRLLQIFAGKQLNYLEISLLFFQGLFLSTVKTVIEQHLFYV